MITEDIRKKITEAQLYWSQGLEQEARLICQAIMAAEPSESVRENVEELTAAMDRNNSHTAQDNSPDQEEQWLTCEGLITAGFYAEAMIGLEGLAATGYKPATIRCAMGECCLRQDDPFGAQSNFEEALKDKSADRDQRLEIMDRLSTIYENNGAIQEAINTLQQIIGLSPTFSNAGQRLAALTESSEKAGRFYGLLKNRLLNMADLERAKELARSKNKLIEEILVNEFNISKEDLGNSLSDFYQCPFLEFDEQAAGAAPSCIKAIKEQFFRANCFIPFSEETGRLRVAVDNPHDLVKIDNINNALQAGHIEYSVALKEDINKFIDYYFGKYSFTDPGPEEGDGVFEQIDLDYEDEDPEPEEAIQADGVVVQMVNKVIEDGILAEASDIHVESQLGTKGIQIRYRIDGECRHYRNIPFNYKRSLVSRLKIMAKLDISERRLPQDGKIKFRTRNGRKIELRVATLPTTGDNEDVVLRILASSNAMPLDQAGILEPNLQNFKNLIEMPYGLIAVVGPTGSGKTTTLHAALHYINRPEKKIWTAEDPVEIVQDGLRQVQVQTKIDLTFARVLKAFLRADPDVIMVGETRDKETATTVIEASLTGHLVFTTMHTNSAPETITRLTGIGIDPFTFADALLGVLAQRLVKRLCPKCKQAYKPDEQRLQAVMEAYGSHPTAPLNPDDLKTVTMFSPQGCPACKQSGYKGRLAIHELLTSNDEIKQLISQNQPLTAIKESAMRNGMRTLMQDAICKTIAGDTNFKHARGSCLK